MASHLVHVLIIYLQMTAVSLNPCFFTRYSPLLFVVCDGRLAAYTWTHRILPHCYPSYSIMDYSCAAGLCSGFSNKDPWLGWFFDGAHAGLCTFGSLDFTNVYQLLFTVYCAFILVIIVSGAFVRSSDLKTLRKSLLVSPELHAHVYFCSYPSSMSRSVRYSTFSPQRPWK